MQVQRTWQKTVQVTQVGDLRKLSWLLPGSEILGLNQVSYSLWLLRKSRCTQVEFYLPLVSL